MGWDGFAVHADGSPLERHRVLEGAFGYYLQDQRLNAAFQMAAAEIVDLGFSPDGLLDRGGLDLSDSARWLERLTGISAYTDYPSWTIKDIVARRSAEWDRLYSPKGRCPCNCGCECGKETNVDKREMGYYLSARKFLEACAAHGLGMRASY